jgi:hypothetical protein
MEGHISIGLGLTALLFLWMAIIAPSFLHPLNKLWHIFGLALSRITSPIVLGVLFFVLLTPLALILRLFGRDQLDVKYKKNDSYWITRSNQPLESDSFMNQY